jgi:hypothetical protein
MLSARDLSTVSEASSKGETRVTLKIAEKIRSTLNAHPAGQSDENAPLLRGRPVSGMQHKYKEIVLSVKRSDMAFGFGLPVLPRLVLLLLQMGSIHVRGILATILLEHLMQHRHITDVLFTGGDPMGC